MSDSNALDTTRRYYIDWLRVLAAAAQPAPTANPTPILDAGEEKI